MSSMDTIAQRTRPIVTFYRERLGVSGILKMALSGLAISLIELGGLALVFPFIKLVTDLTFHERLLGIVKDTPLAGPLQSHPHAVLIAGLAIMALYVLRGYISAGLIRYQSDVAARINSSACDNLIGEAMRSRYQLFSAHSPVKIAGISYSNTNHSALLFQSISAAFNEAALLFVVFCILIASNPLASLFLIALIIVLGIGFFRPLSRRVANIGRQTQVIDIGRHRFVFAMASAIRDIKIMGLEETFIIRNRELVRNHANFLSEYTVIAAVQRVSVEILLVCGVIAASIWLAWTGGNISQMAPAIATMGLFAMRSAPAFSRLAASYNAFRYSLPFVEGLLEMKHELHRFPQNRVHQTARLPGEYRAVGLCFSYGDRQVITDCTLRIAQGEVVAIVGPSGSGKSTLLDLLAGLQQPSAGLFYIDDTVFSPFLSSSFPAQVGYVPQSITLFDDTLAYNIALEATPDTEKLARAVQGASLQGLINSLPQGLQTQLGEGGQGLSGGQRQRVGIARALYRQPSLLILDEVTSALDATTARTVMSELHSLRGKISLLIVTHDLQSVAADRVYRIDNGILTPSSRTPPCDSPVP